MLKACLLGLLLAGSACKGKDTDKAAQSADPPGLGGETIAKLTELKNQACACKDAACGKKVGDDLGAYSAKPQPTLNAAEAAKVATISADLGACMQKALAPTAEPEHAK